MAQLRLSEYNVPYKCDKCGGSMKYNGVGEYKCEKCGYLDYDDYGKVRAYIEKYHGATALQVEQATGVSQRAIRKMIKESKIEYVKNRNMELF